ncbi:J domain-containing protein [Pendulispora rubella]|uniref:J domain-containing protein n=1 Tax=Pendulispora rubella TaxID=2741070 RepID=A0ABZ2L033_9BACT
MSLGSVRPQDAEKPRVSKATVFVSDPSVEAERISQALRNDGYMVVDVPLAMLVARVAVQRPRVVLVDADADGALETVARMRELPDGESIDVLYIGRAPLEAAYDSPSHAQSFVARPVDVAALVKKVDSLRQRAMEMSAELSAHVPSGPHQVAPAASELSAVAEVSRESRESRELPPPSSRRSSPPPPSNRSFAILPPPSMRAERPSQPPASMGSLASLSSLSSLSSMASMPSNVPLAGFSARNALVAQRLASLQGPLSNELAQLLAEAEERVGGAQVNAHESSPPSPDEEIEAVLPEEILAALDEPLVDSEGERDLGESNEGPPARATTSGGAKHTTGAEGRDRTYPAVPPPAPSVRPADAPTQPAPPEGPPRTPPMFGRALASDAIVDALSPSHETPTTPPPQDARTAPPPPQPTTGAQTLAPAAPPAIPPMAIPPPPPTPIPRLVNAPPPPVPSVLGESDAPLVLARAIASRVTGTLCFESKDGVRRAVLREGDIVTCASGVDDESLIAYLVARGDLPREKVSQLAGRFATFGRHAGAALVAQGYLRQDQLWPVLRGHAEWILGRALLIKEGTSLIEPEPPGRLRGEPSVFGGSTGAEVIVEVLRRVVAPEDALQRMGGVHSRIAEGPKPQLLTECALGPAELAILEQGRGLSIEAALATHADTDMGSVLYALSLLGVIHVARSIKSGPQSGAWGIRAGADHASPAEVDALDVDAVRARVRTRMQLVDEGDYFAILGVPRNATGYEVRRAFLELRRTFEPARLLTPRLLDLAPDVRKIVEVLEEAYEILRDSARRERYRRAIDGLPDN